MKMRWYLSFGVWLCVASSFTQAEIALTVRSMDTLEWGALNPARGDSSPRAANVWGDRSTEGPAGFLVQFAQDFASPPHIHNVSYRGVVLEGEVHNDDPGAAALRLPPGAYWTQPRGESHITSAYAEVNLAYIEIDQGPYLVHPASAAFDSGEQPLNMHPRNITWLNTHSSRWVDTSNAYLAFLWGDTTGGEGFGSLLKLEARSNVRLTTEGSLFHAVVVQGELEIGEAQSVRVGAYVGATKPQSLSINVIGEGEALLYIRTEKPFLISGT